MNVLLLSSYSVPNEFGQSRMKITNTRGQIITQIIILTIGCKIAIDDDFIYNIGIVI
jgi:hypothetical protein